MADAINTGLKAGNMEIQLDVDAPLWENIKSVIPIPEDLVRLTNCMV